MISHSIPRCEDCGTMYALLKHFLKEAFVYPWDGPAVPGNRFAEIYTRASTIGMKEHIIEAFWMESSRVVVATIAFGMGLDIHVGPSTDIEDYAQEIARSGRSNQPAKAILISNYYHHASEEMRSVNNTMECRRVYIYRRFLLGKSAISNCSLCSCCDKVIRHAPWSW